MVNRNMPYLYGDAEVLVGHFDYLVEVDDELPSINRACRRAEPADRRPRRRAHPRRLHYAAGDRVHPRRRAALVARHRGLTLWSEMFSDGVLRLEQEGALDRVRPIVASFIFGSQGCTSGSTATRACACCGPRRPTTRRSSRGTADDVGQLRAAGGSVRTGQRVHDQGPHLLRHRRSDRLHRRRHARPEGKAFIALPSWHEKSKTSTIVGRLAVRVTSFQQTAVVTEQGMAHLWGRSQSEQAPS